MTNQLYKIGLLAFSISACSGDDGSQSAAATNANADADAIVDTSNECQPTGAWVVSDITTGGDCFPRGVASTIVMGIVRTEDAFGVVLGIDEGTYPCSSGTLLTLFCMLSIECTLEMSDGRTIEARYELSFDDNDAMSGTLNSTITTSEGTCSDISDVTGYIVDDATGL